MSGSWAGRYAELSPDAIHVLKALTALEVTGIVPDDLAAALAVSAVDIKATVAVLRQSDWITGHPAGGERLLDAAQDWLTYDTADPVTPEELSTIAERCLAYQQAGLDLTQHRREDAVRWASEHKAGVITAIRVGVRADLHTAATELAAAAWRVAGEIADPEWWRELSWNGEEAAIQGKDPTTLIELLNRSAEVYATAGDYPTADAQWVWASKLTYQLGDRDRILAGLTTLLELYRRWPLPEKALNVLLELADTQRRAGNEVERALALAECGSIMFAADRLSSADTYLSRADTILSKATPATVPPVAHARVLEQWGRVLWRLDHRTIRARRCFTRALDLLADHDHHTTTRVQTLFDTHSDDPTLPDDDMPIWPPN